MNTVAILTNRQELESMMIHVDPAKSVFYTLEQQEEFLNSSHTAKVAVIEPDYGNHTGFKTMLSKLEHCDLVIILSMELNSGLCDIFKQFDKPNFKFVLNGFMNPRFSLAEEIPDLRWFYNTGAFYYLDHIELLKKLTPFTEKEYCFEIMYGKPRPHRLFVRQYIESSKYEKYFFQTPYWQTGKIVDKDKAAYNLEFKELWEDDVDFLGEKKYKDYDCTYFGQRMNISQVLPSKIYNKTNFSIVCESYAGNDFTFFTEKFVKPILACRLFILIAGRHSLKNLRSLGFKTFDSIIDESYDEVEDDQQRFTMALKQAEWLCTQDRKSILNKIVPIVTHNFEVLRNLSPHTLSYVLEKELLLRGFHR